MRKKIWLFLWVAVIGLTMLAACDSSSAPPSSDSAQTEKSQDNPARVNDTESQPIEPANTAAPAADTAASVAEVTAENQAAHATAADYQWDDNAVVDVTLDGDTITAASEALTIDGSTITVTSAGTYRFSGSLTDGQITVDTTDEETVRLILNGVALTNSSTAPLNIVNAEKTIIILADGTDNTLTDGQLYIFDDAETDEPNAALFSKSDLTIAGGGSLTVAGNYNDGIASKDGLIISGGTISVNAVDDGIRGKDYLIVEAGQLTITAGGDGLKADNEEEADRGYITVADGRLNITAGGDAVQAETDVLITGGTFTLSSGSFSDDSTSGKGIKAAVNVNIDGGSFTIDSADDAIHSNESLVINEGTFIIASGDDAMHADSSLTINGGDIRITKSYEGIESAVITINAGTIHLVSSDDGLNVAGGNDGFGLNRGQEPVEYTGDAYLYINGGTIVVDAGGDGIDVNGAFEMTDGLVIVNGPTQRMNGALDYDASFTLTGGFLIAAGSSGMAQAPGSSSTQPAVLIVFDNPQPAGTLVHIQSAAGEAVLTFAPSKDYQSIAFTSAALTTDTTYEVYLGGTASGTLADGLYQAGTYSEGTPYTRFTVAEVVTTIGNVGNRGR
jgi:hypothetical protein